MYNASMEPMNSQYSLMELAHQLSQPGVEWEGIHCTNYLMRVCSYGFMSVSLVENCHKNRSVKFVYMHKFTIPTSVYK